MFIARHNRLITREEKIYRQLKTVNVVISILRSARLLRIEISRLIFFIVYLWMNMSGIEDFKR